MDLEIKSTSKITILASILGGKLHLSEWRKFTNVSVGKNASEVDNCFPPRSLECENFISILVGHFVVIRCAKSIRSQVDMMMCFLERLLIVYTYLTPPLPLSNIAENETELENCFIIIFHSVLQGWGSEVTKFN